jgi:hypothetical protein
MTGTEAPAAAANTLAAEYEVGDTGFDPALDGRQGEPAGKPAAGKDAPPPAVEKPKHPARLLKRAAELAIDPETVGKLDTEALDDLVFERLQGQRDEARQASRELLRDPETGKFVKAEPPPADPATPAGKPAAPAAAAEPDLGDDVLAELEAAPGVAKLLKALLADNAALKAHVAGLGRREQARENETRTQQIDRVFGGLKGFEGVFGAGTAAQVKGTPQFQNRVEVLQAAEMLVKRGKPVEDAITTAAKVLYGDKAKPVGAPASPPPPPAGRPRSSGTTPGSPGRPTAGRTSRRASGGRSRTPPRS